MPGLAAAQDGAFPNRPMRVLLAFAPGGGTDLIARTLANAMSPSLGQPVVVENRPGAGGNLATEAAASSRPDGYTMLMGNHGPMSVNVSLFPNMRVNPEQALEPVGLVADAPLVVVVGPKSRAQNLAQLLDEIRAGRGATAYGSASNGSASPLAVTGDQRMSLFPDIPTVAETIPGYKATAWYGILVPRGTPEPVKARLFAAMREALSNPDVIRRLREEGAEPSSMDGPGFAALIKWERERWAEVVRQARITVD